MDLNAAEFVTAIYDYDAQGEDELSLRQGDVCVVISKDPNISGDEGWWIGRLGDQVGIFPSNFVVSGDPYEDVSEIVFFGPFRMHYNYSFVYSPAPGRTFTQTRLTTPSWRCSR